MNFTAVVVAALVPMALGFIWYHPKVLGTVWMNETGLTEEKLKSSNMAIIFGVSLLFSVMLSIMVNPIVIHQMGVNSALFYAKNDESRKAAALEVEKQFNGDGIYANEGRTFKHGAFHGIIAALFFALPLIGINGLFERKSFKYIFLHVGYWIICLSLMGGIISVWK